MKEGSESFYCELHKRKHAKGSRVYRRCLEKIRIEKEHSEDTNTKQPQKVHVQSSSIHVELSQGEILCALKDDAPGEVSFCSGYYKEGRRVFRRSEQPFCVTEIEFSSILNRGPNKYFRRV